MIIIIIIMIIVNKPAQVAQLSEELGALGPRLSL